MINRDYFIPIIQAYFPEPHGSLVNGMIFGVSLTDNSIFQSELKQVGLIHIVVLSGMNISILGSFISLVTAKLSKRTSSMITILSIVLYGSFVGFEAPITRAVLTTIFTHVSFMYGKKTIPVYLLFLAAFCSIVVWPDWISSLSFYLSYGATLGLLIFCSHTTSRPTTTENNPFYSYLKDELQTSLAAQVFTVPIIFYYFRQISIVAPLANILIAWTILPITIFGMLAAFLGSVDYLLGLPFAVITYGLSTCIVFVVQMLASFPFSSVSF